jgi:hypothetical protein
MMGFSIMLVCKEVCNGVRGEKWDMAQMPGLLLWFEYEMSPTGSCVEHLVPKCGRLWKI